MRGMVGCTSYALTRAGTLSVFTQTRTSDGTEPDRVLDSAIKPARIESWLADVAQTDFDALYSSFEEGRCQGCVDGIDTYYILLPGHGDHIADSIKYRLEYKDGNVFTDAGDLINDAAAAMRE